MNTPFFSIIIPVYNVEKYIYRCVESVLKQSFLDFEVIIVDDDSPDYSIKIVNENFSDNRIKIISKNNGGLSDARNFGLEHACGVYVWFIDSDDYITINALEKIYSTLKLNINIDIITFNMKVCFENKNRETYVLENAPENTDLMSSYNYIQKYNIFPYNATLQCYKRSFLITKNYKFTKGIYFEDIYLNLDIYKEGASIIGIKEVLYTYYRREDSITSMRINENHLISQMKVLKKVYNFYIQNDTPKKYFKERLIIEYNRIKALYNNNFLDIDYGIIKNIEIPSDNNKSIANKLERLIFYYFPLFVLKYQVLFRKMNTLENILFKK